MRHVHFSIFSIFNHQVMASAFLIVFLFPPAPCGAYEKIDLPDVKVLLDPPEIYSRGDVLYYNGKITDTSYVAVLNLTINHDIKKISINSIGGDARNAMEIGDYIYKNGLSVDVRSVCASACANYIFPAGKNKYLGNNSYLLWHGGVNGPEREVTVSGNISKDDFFMLQEFKKLKNDDIAFYRRIGVNIRVSFCPQLKDDYKERFPEKWFSYPPEDLEKFGIKNIHYAISASQWVLSMRNKHVIFASYCN